MTHSYEPFTPLEFRKATGLNASDNEAIYMRWLNVQINYANLQALQEISEILQELKESTMAGPQAPRYKHISFHENID